MRARSCARSGNEEYWRGYGSHKRAAAYLKARLATELPVPIEGGVYITVKNADKHDVIPLAQELEEMGFTIYATRGTAHVLRDSGGVDVQTCYRITEGLTPDALDLMRQGKIHLIIIHQEIPVEPF